MAHSLPGPRHAAGLPTTGERRAGTAHQEHERDAGTAAVSPPVGWLTALGVVVDLQERLGGALLALVGEGRAARLSWAELGDALGVCRQAAQQRYAGYVAQGLEQARTAE